MKGSVLGWLGLVCLGLMSCGDEGQRLETPAPAPDPLTARDGRLRDAQGREVLLRGVNARVEGIFDVTFDDGRVALQPIPPFGAEDCRFMAEELGWNLLRLPINWSGIEPEPGVYDDAYIDRALAVIDGCAQHGVMTLVDLHQDAWSKHIGEDGAPLWAIVPPPTELLEGPLTDLAARRTSRQVLAAFSTFFAGEAGLQEAYAQMAAHLASRIADRPSVVGLELMNEPVVPGGQAQLDAFHALVGARVSEVAPELTIFFEPDSLRNFLDRTTVETPMGPGDVVYAPHIYTGVFTGNWELGDVERLRQSVLKARAEADEHGAALLVGEFGNDPRTELGVAWIEAELGLMDEVRASWAFWVYEEWSQDVWGLYDQNPGPSRGAVRGDLARLMARPFPQAVDGELVGLRWDAASRTLAVELTGAGAGAHLISAPRRAWPEGVRVTCDGQEVEAGPIAQGRFEVRCQGSRLEVTPL